MCWCAADFLGCLFLKYKTLKSIKVRLNYADTSNRDALSVYLSHAW